MGSERMMSEPAARESIARRFLHHVGSGRLDEVREMIAETPWVVNATGPHPFWGGRPQPLHVAIETKRRDMFDLLLAQGADVDGANDRYDHWSPLMLTIDRQQADMRAELLARGARVGLAEALMLEDDARVEALLREQGLPDILPNGGSMLAFARTPRAVDLLLARGASADRRDRWGASPIEAMSRLGPRGAPLVRQLIAHGVAASPAEFARIDDCETLARLVAENPAVARMDIVMMAAVDFRHLALVDWLLAHGALADARAPAPSRHTALHSAAWNGDLAMVRRLVAAGADRTLRDEEHEGRAVDWAEVSVVVTNNPACAEVFDYLRALDQTAGADGAE